MVAKLRCDNHTTRRHLPRELLFLLPHPLRYFVVISGYNPVTFTLKATTVKILKRSRGSLVISIFKNNGKRLRTDFRRESYLIKPHMPVLIHLATSDQCFMEGMSQFCVDILQVSALITKRSKYLNALYWPTSVCEFLKSEALKFASIKRTALTKRRHG
jgi:hypothetical protein